MPDESQSPDPVPLFIPTPMEAANLLRMVDLAALETLAAELLKAGSNLRHDRVISVATLIRQALDVLDRNIASLDPVEARP
jgi:hypothetical protein